MKVEPKAEPFTMANRSNSVPRSIDEPIHTVTAENMGNLYKIDPEAKPFVLGQQSSSAPRGTDEPIMTVAAAGAISLIDPQLVVYHGKSNTREIDGPVPSQPTKSKIGLVNPQIVKYYGTKKDTSSIEEPLETVTTKSRFGLVDPSAEPFIVQNRLYYGKKGDPTRAPHDINEPLPAVTGHGAGAIVEPVIAQVNHGDGAADNRTKSVEEPLPTTTTKRNLALIEPILRVAEGNGIDPRRIVLVDGIPHILDIRFRMLSNKELARAMGFDDKETEYEFVGTIAEVTKQIGNAVPVNLAAALVKAIFKVN